MSDCKIKMIALSLPIFNDFFFEGIASEYLPSVLFRMFDFSILSFFPVEIAFPDAINSRAQGLKNSRTFVPYVRYNDATFYCQGR